ncbi:hypothetical protein [uncultured Imperialibacter sp.]|uniref:hypothetical protein n=1 Tax=Imperialibacter sp. TaxID=2038411 RepID=UPI0030D95ED5|tara:strand:+ start:92 stop:367 length:276 start_codon:yes stop_codon:yes gene_type:complete
MEPMTLRDITYIGVILLTGVVTFLTTKHNLSDKIQHAKETLKENIKSLELEIERLKGKDENQQQIIDQFQKQILDHLPDLFEILKDKKGKK